MKGCVGDLGLRDQFGTSLIESGKDVCGSLMIFSSLSEVAFDSWTHLSIDSECLGVDIVDSVTSLMVARILLNASALKEHISNK